MRAAHSSTVKLQTQAHHQPQTSKSSRESFVVFRTDLYWWGLPNLLQPTICCVSSVQPLL